MLDLFKKTVYATVGLAVMTHEKIEEFGGKISKEMKMSESEGKEFVEELLKRSEDMKKTIGKLVAEHTEIALKKLDIPTRKELTDLDLRLKKLEISDKK